MWKRVAVGAVVLTAVGMTGAVAHAAVPDATDPGQVEAFLEARLPKMLEEERIPGAAVSVVAGGKQVVARGYGVADVEANRAVKADETLFRIDSTSKLFTATAVMQLVEQGKVDLHTDVNKYLTGTKVSVPDTFKGKPITLAHLLTHSAGFEELNAGTFAGTETNHPSFGTYLAEHQPARAREPGELSAYSNYGIALAGFVVQTQAKMPFEQYVKQHILEPLGMHHTTFEQPPPPELQRNRVKGHRPDGDRNVVVKDGYDNLGPAGAAIATVTDMSQFMLAHLGVGQERILKQTTAKLMHSKQFTPDKRLPGMAYGFFEADKSGVRVIQHGGDGPGTHGLLTLVPEHGSGIYIAVNGDGIGANGIPIQERISDEFVEHFYATTPHEPKIVAAKDVDRYAGTYRYSRISDTDVSRAYAMMLVTVGVTANADGTVTTKGQMSVDPNKSTVIWVPIGERLFQEKGGTDLLAFNEGNNSIESMSIGSDPSVGWDRLSWFELPSLHLAVVGGSLLVLLTILVWPVIALVRLLRNGPRPEGRAARLVAGAMLLVVLAFLGCIAYALGNFSVIIEEILGGSTAVAVVLTVLLIAAALGGGVIAAAIIAWRKGWWSVAGRIQYSAIALATLGFFTIAYEYNFLAWPW